MPLDLDDLERRVHACPAGEEFTLPRDELMAVLQRVREMTAYYQDLLYTAYTSRVEETHPSSVITDDGFGRMTPTGE